MLESYRKRLEAHRQAHPLFGTDFFRRYREPAYVWRCASVADEPQGFAIGAQRYA
ncbi:MAG: hypothetical protein WBX25_21785 [Rhodomicrobium sp.]